MTRITRRQFLQQTAITAGVLVGAPLLSAAEKVTGKRSISDLVPLGKTGVKYSRLGFGTGSDGGSVQQKLGQTEFTRLIRYAYDQGIRFFDTSGNYGSENGKIHTLLAEALKGIDRSTYVIQTKIELPDKDKSSQVLDRFRKELNTDYFDSVLMHCILSAQWPEELKRMQDDLSQAKDKKIVRMHGVSCHSLPALKRMPTASWLDVALLRINHKGKHMDGPTGNWDEPGDQDSAVAEIKKIHAAGTGVIAMKLIANGDFKTPEERDASIQYVMGLDCVDVAVIGFKSVAEIDEAIKRINTYLNA